MSVELLYRIDEGAIAVAMMVLLVLSTEIGYRVGIRRPPNLNDVAKTLLGTISTGILALLALLLGFTFAMSLERFDHRKHLVMQEANAIGAAYLRSDFLPDPERNEVANLLRRYVDSRLELFRAGTAQDQLDSDVKTAEQLQRQLWAEASKAVSKDNKAVSTGLFVQSLNEVIDLHAERLAAMQNHVPQSILVLLFIVAVISLLGLGYACGLGKCRHLFSTTMLAVLLVLVIGIIIDIDRPRRGLIQVSQQSMIRLQSSLK